MMNVLDALRYRLGARDTEGETLDPAVRDMIRSSLPRNTPPGLPLVVQDSIGNRRSYGEDEVKAPEPWWNAAMGGQLQKIGPQRENNLLFDRGQVLGNLNPFIEPNEDPQLQARPEGGIWSSRPSGISPYASPLNQFLQLGRRAPLSMY